ncbi:putative oxidoreductase [Microlunatus phosphovorus NM-1]|uniref:Pyridine nucleotide-disulfide oxidoreductase domain-containing protein 2 n=1 Tax=Microlunatus phosphovorus (strain ATCC 700054 / DSM 10555 / JCM 9379 / NBRC 101784 / NCIMB 13414 / VKM Ac-1990 / NM-1) TaxID=1032480 RepID=F5XDQ0_MICPN|nr:NAD(P)/FAD-dependent oxidoreductase [Microlunatus phosphovorus]BAK35073.1 putative oxidoreductase [Microlunatus phosphovorus NM-1]
MTRTAEGRTVVVIGSGPNGLVAANLLADAGWQVEVLESQDRPGGAVASAEDVAEGFVHDTFSSFYPFAAASPAISRLGLEEFGLRWRHAPAVLGHPLPSGEWALLHRDAEKTAADLDRHQPGDGQAWLELCRQWGIVGPSLTRALLAPFPPVRAGIGVLARLPKVGGLDFVRMLIEPARSLVESRFRSEAARLLLAGNAMHVDIAMTAPGSGLFGVLLAMLGQTVGFPVPEGGAGRLATALTDRLSSRGGVIRLGVRVERILTEGGHVTGVVASDGEHRRVRAVVADVAAPALYGGLVPWSELPAKVATRMARFELDPATVKVDWALSSSIPWTNAPALSPGTIHLADSVDDLQSSMDLVGAHVVPAKPFLLMGQMTTADSTRSPAGTESVWAYARVPQTVHADEGDEVRGTWDESEIERFADRMQARVEKYAPGFGSRVIARRVLGPRQLQERNENLINGALNGGTANLHQQLIFRPIPGLGRAETPIGGLFLASAAAHPGGGVHGACGANAARALLVAARLGRL